VRPPQPSSCRAGGRRCAVPCQTACSTHQQCYRAGWNKGAAVGASPSTQTARTWHPQAVDGNPQHNVIVYICRFVGIVTAGRSQCCVIVQSASG
jgi:hypothetical protein